MSSTSSVIAIANTPSLNISTRLLSHRGVAVASPASAPAPADVTSPAPADVTSPAPADVTSPAAAINGGGGHDGEGDQEPERGDPGQPEFVVHPYCVGEKAGRDRDREGES